MDVLGSIVMKFIISRILYQICTNRSQVCTFLLKRLFFLEIKMHFSRNTSLSSSSSCFTSMEFWEKEKTARWKQYRSRETKQISRGKYGCFLSLVKETNKKKHNYHMPKFCFQLIHWFYFQPSWPFLQNEKHHNSCKYPKKKMKKSQINNIQLISCSAEIFIKNADL